MMRKINNVYESDSIVDVSRIDIGNREIPVKHYVDGSGNVTHTVNGTKIDELVTERLFRNTFAVIDNTVYNEDKV